MGFHRRSKKPVGRKAHYIDIDYCYGNRGTTWYGGMRPRFGPTLFLALTMNSKDPSGKGPKETWVEQDSHDCNIKIQLTPRNPGPSMPVLAMGLHFTYNSDEAMCDSFYGWDHHAAFPAMIDLIPCLRAFTDCLDTRQECDKGKDEAMWLIAAPGLSTRIQCVLRMRMPSCTSIQCQSNTSAQVSHQTVQSSPNHKSAQGETSQPPPSSNTCTLLLTVWHNMIKWYKISPFNSVYNCSHRMTCLLLLSASRNRLLKSIRKPLCCHHRSLAGMAHGRSHKGSLGFYIAVLRRADLYLL